MIDEEKAKKLEEEYEAKRPKYGRGRPKKGEVRPPKPPKIMPPRYPTNASGDPMKYDPTKPPDPNAKMETLTFRGQTIRQEAPRKPAVYAQNGAPNPIKPGDNQRMLRLARVSFDLPPIDIKDPAQIRQRVNDYFDFCEENDRKASLVGVANWIGVSRDTLASWKRGDYGSAEHQKIMQHVSNMLEEVWVDFMMNGKVNPASGIFIGKNHYQYRDVQDIVVAQTDPLGEKVDKAALADKYLSVTDTDVIDGTGETVDEE